MARKVEIIVKMKLYKMGRAFVCCGEPINVYDWAVTFYGFNEKCSRLRLVRGQRIEKSDRIRRFGSFRIGVEESGKPG